MSDLEAAKDKILMGPERKNMAMSKDVLRVTAYHEAGHALVAYYKKSKNLVHKLTIIPRGRALGVTAFLPKEDHYNHSMLDLTNQIAVAMGGRAAEDIKFGQFTTGAANDIKQASEIARAMVCQYGMSKLGPVNFAERHDNPFLGKEIGDQRHHSEAIAMEIDREVSDTINHQYQLAKQILVDHMDVFESVAQILLEVETLDHDEFVAVINGATLAEIREIQANKIQASKVDDPGSNPPTPTPVKAEGNQSSTSLAQPFPA
jgi:cell division protease FtsH